jgi:1,2-diacylglycerol 3-alpha-glucosyltransferase
MKILIAADTYYPQVNGASYFTQRLAYNLSLQGHEVRVIAPSESFFHTDTIINTVRVHGIRSFPVLFYPKFRFCFSIFPSAEIKKIIHEFNPDIIHVQAHFYICRNVIHYALKDSIPIVATNHFMPDNLIHYVPFHATIGAPIIKAAWNDFASVFNKVGHVTTPTKTASELIQPYFKKNIEAISCGINLQTFNKNNNGEYLKIKYNIKEIPILLYVGRLDKEKNLDMVLRSLSISLRQTTMQLVIAGSGAEKERLTQLAQELRILDKVIFTGFVPDADLPNLYAIAHAFIIAGTAELQSIVTMEAMASGLPVLAVNAVALPELVKDGENGFLFEYGDIVTLAEKMTLLFSNNSLREKMSAKSLEYIAEHAIEKSIAKFERLYTTEINSKLRP